MALNNNTGLMMYFRYITLCGCDKSVLCLHVISNLS